MPPCVRFLLLCFTALVVAAAQAPPGLEQKKGTVEGQVLNAVTGEPLRRANVVLNRINRRPESGGMGAVSVGAGPGGAVGATTDGSGKFSISGIEAGDYMLAAEKTGFLRGGYGGRMGGTLKISAGQEIKDIQFKLTPQAVITGRVVDEEGEPVQYAQIQVLVERYFRGHRQMMPSGSGQTNDRGEYRLANLSPGKYVVSAAAVRMNAAAARPADGSPEMGYATLYYPGVQDLSQATRVAASAGMEMGGVDFRLQKTRVYRVRGKVVDANGGPMRNIFLTLVPRGSAGMFSALGGGARGADGAFEIANVVPGAYTLIARAMDSGQQTSIFYPVDVGEANVDGIVVTPARSQTVEGTVTADSEKVSLQGTRVMLVPVENGQFSGASGTAKDDGSFSLANVVPGKYQPMVINNAEGVYVSSVKLAGQEVLGQDVEITAGAAPKMQVTLSSGAGQVSGTVEGGRAGATVVLVPQDARRNQSQFYRTTGTDQTGAFSFRSVPPGDYKAFAWEEVEYGAWEDPEFLRPMEDQGVAVKVSQRGSETVRLKVISASK